MLIGGTETQSSVKCSYQDILTKELCANIINLTSKHRESIKHIITNITWIKVKFGKLKYVNMFNVINITGFIVMFYSLRKMIISMMNFVCKNTRY